MMNRDSKRTLLATLTKDPFQPVRLYYAIPSRSFVTDKFQSLKCIVEMPTEQCWEWVYWAEAEKLQFSAGYDAVPKDRRPIVLGRIRFPHSGGMVLETNAIARAIGAAKFFTPRLGTEVVLIRCRIVNRYFSADEGTPTELMKTLDHDVSVIDPRQAEAAFVSTYKGVRTMKDAVRAAEAFVRREIASKKDVPMVEDFPLAPEEETPDFLHLTTALNLRLARAFEHWQGNKHLTLTDVIVRAVEQAHGGSGHPPHFLTPMADR